MQEVIEPTPIELLQKEIEAKDIVIKGKEAQIETLTKAKVKSLGFYRSRFR